MFATKPKMYDDDNALRHGGKSGNTKTHTSHSLSLFRHFFSSYFRLLTFLLDGKKDGSFSMPRKVSRLDSSSIYARAHEFLLENGKSYMCSEYEKFISRKDSSMPSECSSCTFGKSILNWKRWKISITSRIDSLIGFYMHYQLQFNFKKSSKWKMFHFSTSVRLLFLGLLVHLKFPNKREYFRLGVQYSPILHNIQIGGKNDIK